VTLVHIHQGEKGTDGPILVTLYKSANATGQINGTLSRGKIFSNQFEGPLAGRYISDLINLINEGKVYVNVHTKQNPQGEIRGQLSILTSSSTTMVATPSTAQNNTNNTLDQIKTLDRTGVVLFGSGKYNESITYFDKALAINPKDVYALTSKGTALVYSGKQNESITYFDKALAINPNDVYALTSKGLALGKLGKQNESITYFDKALAINPKDVMALTSKGLALGRLGKYNESITYFDKALAINPKFVIAIKEKELILAAATQNANSTNTKSTNPNSTATKSLS
jgi:tetratricopeptide (TPR) repeat protein